MKDFTVVIDMVIDPVKNDWDNPKTKSYWYDVKAENEFDAKSQARELFYSTTNNRSIYDIDCWQA